MAIPSLTVISHLCSSHKRPALKCLLLLIVLLIVSNTVVAQSSSLPDLIPYRKGKCWGYKNLEGKIIIRAKYMAVDFFKGDTALVFSRKNLSEAERPIKEKEHRHYGYIHLHINDTTIASIRYNRLKYKPEAYYINKQGQVIGQAPLIHNRDILVCDLKSRHNICQRHVRTGYNRIDMMPESQNEILCVGPMYKNVYRQKVMGANPLMGDSEYKYGLLSSNGDTLTPAKYMTIYLLTFQADTFYRLGNSIFNPNGKRLIKKFEEISITKQGYFLAQKNNRYYYFDRQGKMLIRKFDNYELLPNNMINAMKWPIFSFHYLLSDFVNLRDLQSALYTIDGKKMCKYAGGYKYHIKGNIYGIESTREGPNDENLSNFLIIEK